MSLKKTILQQLSDGKTIGDQFKGQDLSGLQAPDGADFSNAFLRYTKLGGGSFIGADFRNANLRHADFRNSDLRGARFEGADVGKAQFSGALVSGASLFLAKNIQSAQGIAKDKIFFPQYEIEKLLNEKHDDLVFDGETLKVPGIDRQYTVEEAYRVIELIDGEDELDAIGTVVTRAKFLELGAQVYPDTALIHDSGYGLLAGFLGTSSSASVQPAQESSTAAPSKKKDDTTDLELLNDFLLGTLNS